MKSVFFALSVLLVSSTSAAAQYLPLPWAPGYYVSGAHVVYPGIPTMFGPRDILWEVPPPAIRHVVVTKPVPAAPAKLLVNAPKNVEVRYAGRKLTFENGVSVIELPQVEKQTTINLVIHTAKKDVTVPVVVSPGSSPSVRILG
jgi:hypothetical protein